MFGESDSESPRVGSPWDSLISSSPPSNKAELEVKTRISEYLPKLVPEVEYGNVEYKLRLLNPSQERFTRLVTQMKWRLLEGGGQAYYELGVADSGLLIGLSRNDLEQSLETLEMMAGEIGASVIIVKEIEVPAAFAGHFTNTTFGIPERTPNRREHEMGLCTATETSATEDDDGVDTPPSDADIEVSVVKRQADFTSIQDLNVSSSDFEIEIASVYKPRPQRTRPIFVTNSRGKRGFKQVKQKPKSKPKTRKYDQRDTDTDGDVKAKILDKRQIRDSRREARFQAQDAEGSPATPTSVGQNLVQNIAPSIATAAPVPIPVVDAVIPNLEVLSLGEEDLDDIVLPSMPIVPAPVSTPESRLIVEALVVRKLALEEAFLDFGGFALEV